MKTIILTFFALLIIALSFSSFKAAPPRKGLKHRNFTTVDKTLNGYDGSTARKMIANFANNYTSDVSLKSVSAWYNIDQLKAIYKLLKEESMTNNLDGVRIYFGCDQPAGGSTKIKPKIFLVSTNLQSTTYPNQSNHRDYYKHLTTLVSFPSIGDAVNDDAPAALSTGAFLYRAVAPGNDTCINPQAHYLNNTDSYAWVRKRSGTPGVDTSPYNTQSEWFPICFINSLLNSIITDSVHDKLDGLRIYLGKGYKDGSGMERDIFVIVPTKADGTKHSDYYQCLEDLLIDPFCYVPNGAAGLESKQDKQKQKDDFNKFVVGKSFLMFGGYDKGELCPFSCN